jgi:murein DD-endopeptidase MepM/ murein hydrolase activator NlpD
VTEGSVQRPTRGAARKRFAVVLAIATAAPVIGAGAAAAQVSPGDGGGTTAPGDPQVLSIQCVTRCIAPGTGVIKSKIRLIGTDLSSVTMVSMPRADGTRTKDKNPVVKPSGAVLSRVGKGAVTGTVRIADSFGNVRDSAVSFGVGTIAQLKAIQAQYRFPLPSKHTYGDGFGAARDGHTHQGVDIFAPCGVPLIAAHSGVVKAKAYQGSAGNYVVIDAAGVKQDYFYAHLQKPAMVAKGQQVTTGQQVGTVGETGNASGCHLHFEIWTGAGWYSGGKPIDPLETLKYWDSFS